MTAGISTGSEKTEYAHSHVSADVGWDRHAPSVVPADDDQSLTIGCPAGISVVTFRILSFEKDCRADHRGVHFEQLSRPGWNVERREYNPSAIGMPGEIGVDVILRRVEDFHVRLVTFGVDHRDFLCIVRLDRFETNLFAIRGPGHVPEDLLIAGLFPVKNRRELFSFGIPRLDHRTIVREGNPRSVRRELSTPAAADVMIVNSGKIHHPGSIGRTRSRAGDFFGIAGPGWHHSQADLFRLTTVDVHHIDRGSVLLSLRPGIERNLLSIGRDRRRTARRSAFEAIERLPASSVFVQSKEFIGRFGAELEFGDFESAVGVDIKGFLLALTNAFQSFVAMDFGGLVGNFIVSRLVREVVQEHTSDAKRSSRREAE